MIGLDSNILVQLAFCDHPANASTILAVEREEQAGVPLVIPALVVTEFLHVCTDLRRFSPPLTMVAAAKWMEETLASARIKILEGSDLS